MPNRVCSLCRTVASKKLEVFVEVEVCRFGGMIWDVNLSCIVKGSVSNIAGVPSSRESIAIGPWVVVAGMRGVHW